MLSYRRGAVGVSLSLSSAGERERTSATSFVSRCMIACFVFLFTLSSLD